MGGVFLLQGETTLVEMKERPYDREDILQELIGRFPSLLAGDQLPNDEPRRWLLIDREAALPDDEDSAGRWSVDHVFLDQDAVPTLVEVKRSSDTRIRREVVGQMLDYAANAVAFWPMGRLRSVFERRCEREQLDQGVEVQAVLGADGDPEEFWRQAAANLQAGRLRLVFVADIIPRELRRVIEFLNEQMQAEVLGVEVRQYVGEGMRTLVPRVIGKTAAAETRKETAARQWDETSFFSDLTARTSVAEAAAAKAILEWAVSRGATVKWGRGLKDGSFTPFLVHDGRDYPPIAVYTYGRVEIQFQHLLSRPPFDEPELREALRQRLNAAPGIEIPEDALARRPSLQLSLLAADEAALQSLLSSLDWLDDVAAGHTSAAG